MESFLVLEFFRALSMKLVLGRDTLHIYFDIYIANASYFINIYNNIT